MAEILHVDHLLSEIADDLNDANIHPECIGRALAAGVASGGAVMLMNKLVPPPANALTTVIAVPTALVAAGAGAVGGLHACLQLRQTAWAASQSGVK